MNLLKNVSLNDRGGRLKINIFAGFALKGGSMLLSFIFVPLVLSYLTSYKYGIWLTINSVISWFSMMDVGLAGGLRLKLQDSLTNKDWDTSRKYISSTYTMLFIISLISILVFVSVVMFSNLNFASFFKVDSNYNDELRTVLIITIVCFFLRFALQPISVILQADQMDFKQSIMLFMEQVWNLVGILLISRFTKESLLYASAVFSFTPLLNLTLFSVYFYLTRYKHVRPQLFYLNKEYLKPLLGVGIDIFITSISMIFIVQFNNILIVKFYTPNEVTVYNLVVKLFGVLSSFYVLLISPLWSAFGNAYASNDYVWVNGVFRRITKLFSLFIIAYIVLTFISPLVFKIWAHMEINDYLLISLCTIFFIFQNVESTYAYLFNGTGRKKYVKLQRNLMIYGAIVNIPLVVLFSGYWGWGLYSVFVANLVALIPRAAIYIYQGEKLLRNGLSNTK